MDIVTQSRVQTPLPATAARSEPSVTKLHPIIGAQVHGVDLSKPLDETPCGWSSGPQAESTVLLFRNQTITSEDQRRFASYFGPLAERLKPPEKSGSRSSRTGKMI